MADNSPENKPIRVVVTGGHYTPALAVIEALGKRGNFEFRWVGHRYSFADRQKVSPEYRAVTKIGIPFHDLRAGKLYGIHSLKKLIEVPMGVFYALHLLLKIRPRLIISFGGYLAAPVVLAGFFLRIPAVTHEQTAVSGWANRFIGRLAKKVFISWKQSAQFFPSGKVVLTGNPLREAIFKTGGKHFHFPDRLTTVYVTGGKQGAHVINETVRNSLSEILERYNLIHQIGDASEYRDYQRIMMLKGQLPSRLRRRYVARAYFGEDEIGAVYKAADIVVGRAGANTVTEVAALGKPAILIPIPWVSHDEQTKNAQLLEKLGSAIIIPQEKLSPDSLLGALKKIAGGLERYRRKAEEAREFVDLSAADKIAEEVMLLLGRRERGEEKCRK
jgi:UDP-N-acetylglucosamine--N-acetylmuramyl-(pentapeptide) pyrophosphoryl-undecaprenol N-acetylglucosamine transferase